MNKRTLCCLAAAVLMVIESATAALPAPPQLPSWLAQSPQGARVLQTILNHRSKTPPEFFDRLKYVLPNGTLRVMVNMKRRTPAIERSVGAETSALHWYGDAPRFYADVTPHGLSSLLRSRNVIFVEPDYPIRTFLSTAAVDVRARSALGDQGGPGLWSFDLSPEPHGSLVSNVPGLSADQVTGKGVVVADTDTGIDRTNRDFAGWNCDSQPYQPCSSRIIRSVVVDEVSGSDEDQADLPTTDLASGHGTHTAGIIAGNGAYSRAGDADPNFYGGDGYNFGLAPQASLISVKLGDSQSAALGSDALQWELDHAAKYDIRISSNSWGCATGCSFDPKSATAAVLRDLYKAGVLVTFAVGNNGGGPDGAGFAGNAQSPYVLGVAAYDDEAQPEAIADFSSRGVADEPLPDPSTWTPESEDGGYRRPDLSAPGVNIWSSANLSGGSASLIPRITDEDAGRRDPGLPYAAMSGTSMATPMVSGAAALLIGACPNAPTLEIMRALMAGADRDRVMDTDGSRVAPSYETGYGALDVRASLDWLRARPSCAGSSRITPNIDAPREGIARQAVTFDASRSRDDGGSITTYTWDFGDGKTGSGATVTHIYRRPGYYTATLSVVDDQADTGSKSFDIAISRPPTFVATGHIQLGEPLPATVGYFILRCPDIPPTQGVDAYIFTLPKNLDTDGQTVTIHELAQTEVAPLTAFVSVFTDDCDVPINTYTQGGPDVEVTLPADSRFIAVEGEYGKDVDVSLSVHPPIPERLHH